MYRFVKSVTIGFLTLACIFTASPSWAAGTRLVESPHYSGGNIVFGYMGDIWLQPKGDAARPITSHPGTDIRPRFSPDGKWIAFISNRTGNWDVFIVPAEGGMPKQLTYHSGADVSITWTTDSGKILFRTRRGSTWGSYLYTVAIDGDKMPGPYLATRGYDGTFSQDGKLLAYTQRSASYGRRRDYTGSANAKIHILDTEKKTVRRLLDTDRHENSPMIAGSDVYYVCERGGAFNIWKAPLAGGEPKKITNLPENGVSSPSISADGLTILFEHEFNIWKLDVKTGKASEVPIRIEADYREQPVSHRKMSKCDDYNVSPDETRVVISTHGEIFTIPVDKGRGRVVQITDGPARDRKPAYSPDGKKIAFISDRSGRDEVYVVDVDGKNPVKVTDSDTRKYEFDWSPGGKHISVSMSDKTLWVFDLQKKTGRKLLQYKETTPRGIHWSPDGKWIAFLKSNKDLEYDVCIISAVDEKVEEHIIVEDLPFDEYIVTFTKEKLFFLSSTEIEGGYHLYSVSLAREAVDPDDPDVKASGKKKAEGKKKSSGAEPKKKEKNLEKKPESEEKKDDESKEEKKEAGKPEKKKEIKLPEVKIDFARIEKRVQKLFEVKSDLDSAAVSPDGKKIVVLIKEPVADEERVNMYTFDPKAEKGKFKRFGSATEVTSLSFSPKGGKIFFISDGRLYHRVPGAGKPKTVSVSVNVRVDTAKEFEQIFHECWRIMKHTFYDPKMHDVDWVAMRDKYAAVLPSVTDRDSLDTVINRMLGELKASHMGYYTPRGERS
jgi:tricorn protease